MLNLDQVIDQEGRLTRSFDPAEAKIYPTFEVDEHYNLVIRCPKQLQDKLSIVAEELAGHSDLHLTTPDNYHLTVLIIPLSVGKPKVSELKELLPDTLQLLVKGLHIRPAGVFVNVYCPDGELGRLRQRIAEATHVAFDPADRLANVGWITLGRFKNRPAPRLIAYIQERVDDDFGTLQQTPSLHQSNNRQKLGRQLW